MMSGPDFLASQEDNWQTSMGLVFPGDRVVFRGKDLFSDLRNARWMDIFLYGITGRRFDENQIRLFECIWSLGTSYPDPRIWNNRVASLAGTVRSTANLGISAALSVSEATVYGRRPDVRAIDFLYRTSEKLGDGMDLSTIVTDELARHRGIAGYGRPLVNADERIKPVCEVAESLGFGNGRYLRLIFEIEEQLIRSRYRFRMNAAALGAALAADQGLSTYEYYLYLIPSFVAGMIPCYMEAASRTEGAFLPLACDRIEHVGRGPRAWGRSRDRDTPAK